MKLRPATAAVLGAILVLLVTQLSISRSPTAVQPPSGAGSPPARSPAGSSTPETFVSPGPSPVPDLLRFGTLLTDPGRAQAEYEAGIRLVHLELAWDQYEPRDGEFSAEYAEYAKQTLRTLRATGMGVVLGAGVQYAPDWLYEYPESRYVNQYGLPGGGPNLTFNTELRRMADRYLERIDDDLQINSFVAVRVGAGTNVEVLYPSENADGVNSQAFWAYDSNAQSLSPFPKWRPGDTTYRGEPFTTTQVDRWYRWYVSAMAGGVRWQADTYRRLGFTGDIHVLMPGQGMSPARRTSEIQNYLVGSADPAGVMGRGAAWDLVIDELADLAGLVVYVSSVADGSGSDDTCDATDTSVRLDDPQLGSWSATRWLAWNAHRHGLRLAGENAGPREAVTYGSEMLHRAVLQAIGCGFTAFLWAHDADLYRPESGVTLDDLRQAIEKANAIHSAP